MFSRRGTGVVIALIVFLCALCASARINIYCLFHRANPDYYK